MSHGIAKVKPSATDCQSCMNTAESYNATPDCTNCHKEQTVEILQFVSSFFGAYAICKNNNNEFVKVNMHQLELITSCPICGKIDIGGIKQ